MNKTRQEKLILIVCSLILLITIFEIPTYHHIDIIFIIIFCVALMVEIFKSIVSIKKSKASIDSSLKAGLETFEKTLYGTYDDLDKRDISDITYFKKLDNEDDPFYVGNEPNDIVKSLQCVKCNGLEFNVATADFITVIRCIKCRYEVGIHEG